jgi:hypothetical protein
MYMHAQRPAPQALQSLLLRRWRLCAQPLERLNGCRCARFCAVRHGLCQARLACVTRGDIKVNQGNIALIGYTGL